jgi:beta-1,4-mannosyltransferase
MTGPLRVLQSVKQPTSRTNPYIIQLVDSLSPHAVVRYFSWRRGLFGRYDVFHLHWPEVMVRRDASLQRWAALGRFALLLSRLSLQRRIAVVRTLHNLGSHESGGRVERLLLAWCDRRTDHWIGLNSQTPVPPGGELTVILHGDYRTWFERYPLSPVTPGRILYFGLIRPYKGVDTLLGGFGWTTDPGLTLRIVGKPVNAELTALVTDAVRADSRISARLEYVDDEALAAEIGQAQLVVLPYQDIHNSGALLLALSLGRPALVPRAAVTVALAEEVGDDWVHTYSGPLTGAVLSQALSGVKAGRLEPQKATEEPNLDQRSWTLIGAQHAALYRSLVRRPVA